MSDNWTTLVVAYLGVGVVAAFYAALNVPNKFKHPLGRYWIARAAVTLGSGCFWVVAWLPVVVYGWHRGVMAERQARRTVNAATMSTACAPPPLDLAELQATMAQFHGTTFEMHRAPDVLPYPQLYRDGTPTGKQIHAVRVGNSLVVSDAAERAILEELSSSRRTQDQETQRKG